MLDKRVWYCHTYDAEKYSEDVRVPQLQVHWFVRRFQQTGSVEVSKHYSILKNKLDVIKAQNGSHITDLV